MEINWKRVLGITAALIIPGGMVVAAAYVAYKHAHKEPVVEVKPFRDCVGCLECMVRFKHRGFTRWFEHLMNEHNCTQQECEATLHWMYAYHKSNKWQTFELPPS